MVTHKLVMHMIIMILYLQGNCITTASPSDVCRLNSFASRCDNSLATNCTCYPGYDAVDEKNCKGIVGIIEGIQRQIDYLWLWYSIECAIANSCDLLGIFTPPGNCEIVSGVI